MINAERQRLIQQIRELPHILEQMLKNLGDRQLDTPYRKDGWTVRQVVHHLVDAHVNAYIRLKLIVTEDHPTLKPYDQDEWAKLYDASRLPVDISLKILFGLHERMACFFEHLSESDWQKTGYHDGDHQDWTPDYILKVYAGHGAKHLGHISDLLKKESWI